jgi:hypothetical protein
MPEPILLQHFRMGLNVESAKFLDTSFGGSFSHFTPSEGRVVLRKILENTPYIGIFDEFPDEEEEPKPDALSEQKPIEEKPTSIFLHEESLLYPRVYPADFSHDLDEESTTSNSPSESEFIEEEPILEKFISTATHPPLTKLGSQGNHSNLIESSITPRVTSSMNTMMSYLINIGRRNPSREGKENQHTRENWSTYPTQRR